jgi:uncharacterized protein
LYRQSVLNPFLINTYASPFYFCDREAETKTLISNIDNQSNTAFFAQRRIGKTALIQHVFYHLIKKKTGQCIYIDIYATQNLKDFTNQLANGIYKIFPESKGIGRRFLEAVRLLRPVLSMDDITGSPQLSLDISQPRQLEKTIPQLLQFLDAQKIRTVIAIDEFQQILSYPEKNIEALLRTVLRQLKNVNFIFSGSNQKMMREIFNSAKRPFYSSTKSLNLKKIDPVVYSSFIRKHFENNRSKITEDALESILGLTACHTYYTQRLCHEVFALNEKTIGAEVVLQALSAILNENESTYFQYRNLITRGQWNLLKAIATEEKVSQPYAGEFIYKHQLGTPANVKRGIEALLEKEMVFYDTSIENPFYEVNDRFLMLWLQRI